MACKSGDGAAGIKNVYFHWIESKILFMMRLQYLHKATTLKEPILRIPIIKFFKESYVNVLSNKLTWFKVGFAPMILLLFVNFSNILKLINIEQIKTLVAFLLLILYGIGQFSLWINGYRYGILNEGGRKWWNMPNINQFSLMLVYTILVGLLIFSFGYMEIFLFDKVTSILGLFCFLVVTIFGLYSWFRLTLVSPLISIGIDMPIRESWRLMKGNVLRMWGLTILILLPVLVICAIVMASGLYTYFLSDITFAIEMIILLPIMIIFSILYWAIFAKATSLVYLFLSQQQT